MRALLIVILASLAACVTPFGEGGDPRPLLVNRTGNALLYVAFGLEDGPLVDPNPAIDPADAPERLVADGDELAIEVSGYSESGVLLFIYEIPARDHEGAVPISRTIQVSREQLLRADGRIVVGEQ